MTASPGRQTNPSMDRKSHINQFLCIHVVVLISLLIGFNAVGCYIYLKYNIKTVEDIRNNTSLTRFNFTGFVTQVCINTYIAILLSIIQGRTIYYLKK